MAQKMTRGQIQDLLASFARDNPRYREAVKALVETADTMYVVVPHIVREGKLPESDLEKVAGGFLDSYDIGCSGALNTLTQLSL
jgi:hypothetical protein